MEMLAFEGVHLKYSFTDKKADFGDIFLVTGSQHPDSPPKVYDFKHLAEFGFEQVDDFFGIPNKNEDGDDVKIWLIPTIDGEEAYQTNQPFDGFNLVYNVLRNTEDVDTILKKIFNKINSEFSLIFEAQFEGETITSFDEVEPWIKQIKDYCRTELEVEPGSDEALELDF